jgi:hypothetical protein
MELIFFLTLIVSFIGLYAGLVLARVAREELKSGKRYFVFMQQVLLLIMIALMAYFYKLYVVGIIIVVLIAALLYFLRKVDISRIIYSVLGAAFTFSFYSQQLFYLTASLVFIYGFPTSSLIYLNEKNKKAWFLIKKVFFNYFYYLVVALVIYFALNVI